VVVVLTFPTALDEGYFFLASSPTFVVAILTGERWNHSVVLICISFMASDGKYFSCAL
jgi:hypothetical protein